MTKKNQPVDEVNRAFSTATTTVEIKTKKRTLDKWHSVRGVEMFALTSPHNNSRMHPHYCSTNTVIVKNNFNLKNWGTMVRTKLSSYSSIVIKVVVIGMRFNRSLAQDLTGQ